MAEFTINIREIESVGRKQYTFAIGSEWLSDVLSDTEFRGSEDHPRGKLMLEASKLGVDLLLKGTVKATLIVPCSRCTEELAWSVDTELTHLLSPLGERETLPEELELTPEDLDREYYRSDQIELDGLIRESLILAVPMQPVHPSGCNKEVMNVLGVSAKPKSASPLASLIKLKDKLGDN